MAEELAMLGDARLVRVAALAHVRWAESFDRGAFALKRAAAPEVLRRGLGAEVHAAILSLTEPAR